MAAYEHVRALKKKRQDRKGREACGSRNIIDDVLNLFPEPFYHSGIDEIIPGCWKSNETIQSFLSNNGALGEVLEIFINSTLPYILSLNRTVVYWEDVLLDDIVKVRALILPKENVILRLWNNGHNNTKRIVSSGYRAIVSCADFYWRHGDFVENNSKYDYQTGDHGDGDSWCGPFKIWQNVYNYDIDYGLIEEE
ncbi:hypothetical protein FEM48_Zijuj09G0027100 [Ziziphus jujuba var. spinosa]|uniref:beta-N-acetylhexosaminidase n=1 Tax=Ziziphus jujuba var. spinosa TaxID=714518 RepID=A0A978UQF5_ZIZJJ|nr:hypothetical protein FEM48_Zijuj09G0027100 [Ziziphus jujuba var. spinosa]